MNEQWQHIAESFEAVENFQVHPSVPSAFPQLLERVYLLESFVITRILDKVGKFIIE
ncbi:unnamed protein product [Nesidiocoris tenuis]|uniref:Uncharacterized protein n=1 Tax=Nesidiocoris tenuis TaxID=355587 RepID=A0A6H5HH18_9HEMI|nr:unnamed protein product [Nesidiocoris tenuis]